MDADRGPEKEEQPGVEQKLALLVSSLVTFIGEQYSKTKKNTAEQDRDAANNAALVRHASRTAYATIIIAGASILTFGTALLQYFVFTAQLKEMRSGSIDTHALAKASEASIRAWVAPIKFTLDASDASNPLRVIVSYQNVGHEPAEFVKDFTETFWISNVTVSPEIWKDLPNWKEPEFKPRNICRTLIAGNTNNTSVIYPTANTIFNIETGKLDPAKVPGGNMPSFVNAIKQAHAIFIVTGCFSYQTVGMARYSSFCALLNPGRGKDISTWNFAECPYGNNDFESH